MHDTRHVHQSAVRVTCFGGSTLVIMAAAYRTALLLVKGSREFTRAGYEQAEHNFDNTPVPSVSFPAPPFEPHFLRADRTARLPASLCAGIHMACAACSALNKGLEGKVCLVTGANLDCSGAAAVLSLDHG